MKNSNVPNVNNFKTLTLGPSSSGSNYYKKGLTSLQM